MRRLSVMAVLGVASDELARVAAADGILASTGQAGCGVVRGRAGRLQAHTGDVEGLTAFEVKAVCARLAATAPYLRKLAKVVPPDQLWRVCRKECQGRDLHDDGWIIKPRWFGIVVVATGPRGKISGPSLIEWRTFAGHVTGPSRRS